MARITVTESELAEAIRESLAVEANPDDAFTLVELQQMLGFAHMKTRATLKQLRAAGRLEVVKKRSEAIDGRTIFIPAYRVLRAKR